MKRRESATDASTISNSRRPRSSSNTSSTISTSTPLRRPPMRPNPLSLSPLGSSSYNSPNSTSGAQSNSTSPRYLSFSHSHSAYAAPSAPSIAGSVASISTTQIGGVTRFKRGHARKKVNVGGAARSMNPDELDLMTLEDPNEPFRLFGVREVRGLEKRASDAAAAKVAELRTMVGERYRDLLSAADSIVRMRSASEKLVDSLEKVEGIIVGVGGEFGDTPSKKPSHRPPHLISHPSHPPPHPDTSTSLDSPSLQTLSNPPTLSLTIHVLLTLPSLVHTLLETNQFLSAARLEGIGRVVYRELSDFEYAAGEDEEDEGDEEGEEGGGGRGRGLKEAFPIIEKQWESVSTLNKGIVRRAMGDLGKWDQKSITIAETLAAIYMLENSTLSNSFTLLLSARSKSLSTILEPSSSSSSHSHKKHHHHEIEEVLDRLEKVLGIVLKTVRSAGEIFGGEGEGEGDGLLRELLKEIENPSGTIGGGGGGGEASDSVPTTTPTTIDPHHPKLVPALSTLPNYPLLARHLPSSILSFTPFLSIATNDNNNNNNNDNDRNHFPSLEVSTRISNWLKIESERVVEGIKGWIKNLRGGARTLGRVRIAVRAALPLSSEGGGPLRKLLEEAIEERLEIVYKNHLNVVVERVPGCLKGLLESLERGGEGAEADRDSSYFLFERKLVFPPSSGTGHYSTSSISKGGGGALGGGKSDPYKNFLGEVMKRVEGKSPLIEKGLGELEAHARELREDLVGWIGGEEGGEKDEAIKSRLREQYVNSAKETFDGVYRALVETLKSLDGDVTGSLFLGNFAFMLSQSKTFTRDLLLGSKPLPDSEEGIIVSAWLERLKAFQETSLESWRKEAVEHAVEDIEMSTKNVGTSRWVTQASSLSIPSPSPPLPFQPSTAILGSLRNLVIAIRRVGPHRTQSDPTITNKLLLDFESKCLPISKDLVGALEGLDKKIREQVAMQAAWDVVFLERFWNGGNEKEWREVVQSIVKISGQKADVIDYLSSSTLSYLQRTQTIFSVLLSPTSSSHSSLSPPYATSTNGSVSPSLSAGTNRLLPWGNPIGSNEFKSTIGVVRPGVRLGLLPTRS